MNAIKLKSWKPVIIFICIVCSDCSFLFPDDIIRSGNCESERICG